MQELGAGQFSLSLIAPELTLCLSGFIILILGITRRLKEAAFPIALVGMIVALWLGATQWGIDQSGFFQLVVKDSFSSLYNFIFLTAGVISLLIARSYLRAKDIESPEFYALLVFSVTGMMTMAATYDMMLIFIGLEVMSVPLYVMAGADRKSPKSLEASLKYFIMGAFASGFLLYGIALVYGATASTDLRYIAAHYQTFVTESPWLLYIGAALALVGFAFKVAAVPFHMWAPDVYQGAPTPVTAFFSVGPKAAGFAALMRIFVYGFGRMDAIEPFMWALAALTMVVGNLLALYQDNVKRMLAYSSIAHAGYILVAMTVGGEAAVSSGLYYLVAYTFFNLGAFAILTMLDTRSGADSRFDELTGMAAKHPYLATLLALFMFALAGFPPTAGFFGKFYIFSGAVEKGFIWLAIIGVLSSFVSVYYYLKVVVHCFFQKSDHAFAPVILTPYLFAALLITTAGALGLGLFPARWIDMSQQAFFSFLP